MAGLDVAIAAGIGIFERKVIGFMAYHVMVVYALALLYPESMNVTWQALLEGAIGPTMHIAWLVMYGSPFKRTNMLELK